MRQNMVTIMPRLTGVYGSKEPAPVPFTLQTFAIFLCSAVLGARRGLIAVLLYVLLGALGLPVFAGMQGGFGVLVGATGGYITGFLPAAVIAGWKSTPEDVG